MLSAKHVGLFTPVSVLLLSLCVLTTTAFRRSSYNERVVASAQLFSRARAAVEAQRGTASVLTVQLHREANDLLQQLLDLEPAVVRQALMDSVTSLSERYDVSMGPAAGQEALEEMASQETPEDYHTCLNHTAATVIAVAERQPWALQMIDAMGKPGSGISNGNLLWLGSYDECLNVRANTSVPSHPSFSGQYYNVYTSVSAVQAEGSSAILALGVCFPDTCSQFDVTSILNDVLFRLGVPRKMGVELPPRDVPLDAKAVVAILFCSVLLTCMVLGTLADVLYVQMPRNQKLAPYSSANGHSKQDEHLPLIPATSTREGELGVCVKALVAFSVYTNGSKLLSTSQPAGSITCIHGIRFLSMTWVVLGHGFLYPQQLAANMLPFLTTSLNRWTFQAVVNALVSVDSFFVLSGLLVSYLTLKEMKKKNGRLNWFLFYFHRFWRLTPAYMLVIMIYVCLSPYWGDGPMWPSSNPDRDNCEDNWWTNLLYINTLVKPKQMCLGQSWYLANDMQFYCILSPIVILALFYAPLWGVVAVTAVVLGHCIANGVLSMQNHYPPGIYAQVQSNDTNLADFFTEFYMKPYTRMGPYVIGMLAGYFLHVKQCKLNIKWYVNSAVWAVATGAALAVLYGLYGASTGHPVTVPVAAFYNAVHRNVWGACVSWVVIACATGNGGFVNTLLSWSALVPLSRLTYCIYLLHIMIINLYLENSRTIFYFSDVNVVMFFLSVLIVSYMAAFVASLAFEAPMMALEKLIFRIDKKRDEPREQHNNSHDNTKK